MTLDETVRRVQIVLRVIIAVLIALLAIAAAIVWGYRLGGPR